MNVEYLTADDAERGRLSLRTYCNGEREIAHHPDLNYTTEFDERHAHRIARAIARHGGYARVLFGAVIAEYGDDPRAI